MDHKLPAPDQTLRRLWTRTPGYIRLTCAAALVLGLLALLIALSRVLSGVHYPSDVLGGLVFGAAASWLGTTLWFFFA